MPETPLFDLVPFHDADAPAKAIEAEIMPPGIWKGKPRPTGHHVIVKRLAIGRILPEILEWLEEDAINTEEVVQQLLDAVSPHDDGFEIAKRLEDRFHWSSDSDLVNILDDLPFWDAEKKAIARWVEENSLLPKFAVGNLVEYQSIRNGKTLLKGQITRIDLETGHYVVMIPELGHVPEGRLGSHGLILEWEKVEEVNPIPPLEVVNG